MADRVVAVGEGGCGRVVAVGTAAGRVAVGAAPDCVAVGFGGGDTEPAPEGITSCVPMLMMSLVNPLASIRAWTAMPNLLAMPLSVSPACTT